MCFCMIGERVVFVWCMCGVWLVRMDVYWAVFVVCIANVFYILACDWCMFWLCVA